MTDGLPKIVVIEVNGRMMNRLRNSVPLGNEAQHLGHIASTRKGFGSDECAVIQDRLMME